MSDGQQHVDAPAIEPGADAPVVELEPGAMVRTCERCGTVCSADQEWCLTCGVRMSSMSPRLPGLRAAGLVVSLAVLLAGGAAAASYAALRSDTEAVAAAPAGPAGTPVTPAPVTPATPTSVVPPPVDTTSVPESTSTDTSVPTDLGGGGSDDQSLDLPTPTTPSTPSTPPAPITPPTTTPKTTTTTPTTTKKTETTTTRTTETTPQTGPLTLASGQGSLYDPQGIVADRGEEGNAIDGRAASGWTVTLVEGQTGGFGYVLDFDDPLTLRKLTVTTPTGGLTVKVLGTNRITLPLNATDSDWSTLADDTKLSTGGQTISLKGTKKLRHVLLLISDAPGSPAKVRINEIQIAR